MPRLRHVPRSDVSSPVVAAMYERLFGPAGAARGSDDPGEVTGSWWTVFALVPDVLEHLSRGFGLYASPDRKLDPVLRELGQTRAGWVVGSQFVYSWHCKILRDLGVPADKVDAIRGWAVSDLFTPRERAVLALTDALVRDFGRVDESVFDALRADLSDKEILEFTYVTTMYAAYAVMARALRLEFDDRDDPMVEIDAPEDEPRRAAGRELADELRRGDTVDDVAAGE